MKYILFFTLSFVLFSCSSTKSDFHAHLKSKNNHEKVLSSEGQYVMVFNPEMKPFVKDKIDKEKLIELKNKLAKATNIELTQQNFTKAAERFLDESKDNTNYDAVWVRDNAWVYFSFIKNGEKQKAQKLINALWNYYASNEQVARFEKIIKEPRVAKTSKMEVPHIRFNGKSKTYQDVFENGRPQLWNHRQNDAHGLFLLALANAFKNKIATLKDAPFNHRKVLKLFPQYFLKVKFHQFAGAGAWEEIDKINTSSVAMVTKAFERWSYQKKLFGALGWSKSSIERIINFGYLTINKQLSQGGESPSTSPYGASFRQADAALFNLFLPMPLERLSQEQKILALTIIEKLIRPYGVIRYENDSYQAGNYWIKEKDTGEPDLTGDASSDDLFLARFKSFMPNSEAQWFFDSKLSMIYSGLYKNSKNLRFNKIAKYKAIYHLKRAIGQITGSTNGSLILAADGKEVRDFQIPESINTIKFNNEVYYAPSPITPLNWAKASLTMAMIELDSIL